MAGLGRIQQRFNLAVVGALAALIGFARGGAKAVEHTATQAGSQGYPLARKYVRSQNVAKVTGRGQSPYPGYCSGVREIERRRRRQLNPFSA